ncbi:MAG: hypothetical protein ACKO1M_11110, partial [Planctomycetota bacterium]
MKTLEKRLFHLFPPADVARARQLAPAAVSCPRVGQVRATVADDDGEHEVCLDLTAHRRGGMTLESRCSTTAGRAGRPCAVLAAVLLEVDRRGLLSGIHDQTPVTLEILGEDGGSVDAADLGADEPPVAEADDEIALAAAVAVRRRAASGRGGPRLPPWAAEL